MRPAKKLIRTASLLVLALVFQLLWLIPFINELTGAEIIIGALINMCLCLSVLITNEAAAGLLIGVCAPVAAFFQGYLAYVALIPFAALGNAALAICFYYLQKRNKYAAAAVASAAKWGIMFLGGKYLLHFFLRVDYDELKAITASFNLPQLVSSLAGSIFALIVYKLLPKSVVRIEE